MSAIVSSYYFDLLDQAQRESRCLVPDSKSAQRHFQRLYEKGVLLRPMRGIYARPAYWDGLSPEQRHLHCARAYAQMHPDWVFCSYTAAVAYGLSVSWSGLGTLHVASKPGSRKRATADVSHHTIGVESACEASGLPVTSLARTAFDCLCKMDFRDGLALADSFLRITGTGVYDLLESLSQYGGPRTHGYKTACKSAVLADARSESGGESIARAAMIEHGFALPELQKTVADPVSPWKRYRVDFSWKREDGSELFCEFDGREKYRNPSMTQGRDVVDVLADERIRESRLSATGVPVLRLSYADLQDWMHFDRLLATYGVPRAA